jgi:hypothetical protein
LASAAGVTTEFVKDRKPDHNQTMGKDYDDDDDDDDEKSKFEAERDKVLSELPQALKDKFGTIGFCLVENDDDEEEDEDGDGEEKKEPPHTYYQPVLIVSPYEVPPKPVRDIYWMDAFTKAKRSKAKLVALDYLVYVYGSDDPDDCYNFVSQDEFVSLEDARAQGLDQLPEQLQERVKAEEALSEVESKLVRGFEEMREDLAKEPQDRKPQGKFAFSERHEEQQKKEPPTKKQKT